MPNLRSINRWLLSLILVGSCLSCDGDKGVTPPVVNKGTPVYVRDFEFAEGRVYDLGAWFEFGDRDSVRALRVFEQDMAGGVTSDSAMVRRFPQVDSNYTTIKVSELPGTDFDWFNGMTKFTHYVEFHTSRTNPLAVYMEIARYDISFAFQGLDTIGFIADTGIKKLKLIRALAQDYDSTHSTWDLMWRNVYAIPQGSAVSELFLNVRKGAVGSEGTASALDYQQTAGELQSRYLAILGLDQLNARQGNAPDGILDDRKEVFRPDWGLIVFPSRHPFATNSTYTDWQGASTPVLKTQIESIYSLPRQQSPADSSSYYIEYFVRP